MQIQIEDIVFLLAFLLVFFLPILVSVSASRALRKFENELFKWRLSVEKIAESEYAKLEAAGTRHYNMMWHKFGEHLETRITKITRLVTANILPEYQKRIRESYEDYNNLLFDKLGKRLSGLSSVELIKKLDKLVLDTQQINIVVQALSRERDSYTTLDEIVERIKSLMLDILDIATQMRNTGVAADEIEPLVKELRYIANMAENITK